MIRRLACLSALLLLALPAAAAVVGKEVSYADAGTTYKGYYAVDDSIPGRRPGVLVVHEWWGHNAYARSRADQLAALGYAAFAVDMYGNGQTADNPTDAGKLAGGVMGNPEAAKARFEAARAALASQPTADGSRVAAIGYCFGGGVVLHMARLQSDLKGVASFHGSLGTKTPAEKGKLKAAILVCHGDADPLVPAEAVAAFKKEMADAGADLRFKAYPGATHAFSNPEADERGARFNLPIKYDAKADKESWAELQSFLKDVLK